MKLDSLDKSQMDVDLIYQLRQRTRSLGSETIDYVMVDDDVYEKMKSLIDPVCQACHPHMDHIPFNGFKFIRRSGMAEIVGG